MTSTRGKIWPPGANDAPTDVPAAALTHLAALAFLEAVHQFDEIAGLEAIVELPFEDVVPAVLTGAG